MKPELFDLLVTLPPHSKSAANKAYPSLSVPNPSKDKKSPQQTELKATQRDVRRYTTLRKGLRRVFKDGNPRSGDDGGDDNSDAASTFSTSPIVEPLSWTRLAYTSFIWWASAGEKRDGFSEEEEEEHEVEQDARLLASVDSLPSPPSGSIRRRNQPQTSTQPLEIALVAYFRQLTTQIFATLSDLIARRDDQTDTHPENDTNPYTDEVDGVGGVNGARTTQEANANEEDESTPLLDDSQPSHAGNESSGKDAITISAENMAEMGLDTWSTADRIFVEELVRTWWGRDAYVDSARIRCCGVAIL